jgi:hypothetical protein
MHIKNYLFQLQLLTATTKCEVGKIPLIGDSVTRGATFLVRSSLIGSQVDHDFYKQQKNSSLMTYRTHTALFKLQSMPVFSLL